MPEWWTYGLGDAQIFSARAYDRLVERCMREAWPAQWVIVALGLAVLAMLWRWPKAGSRALAAACALACGGVAAWWLPQCYAELHWAAGWMAAGFALQVLLLAGVAAWPGALDRGQFISARAAAGTLFAFSLVALPWLSMPAGSGAWRAELIGLMPAPTIAASFAVVPLASMRWRFLLLPLPLAGMVMEAVSSASIDRPQWMLLPSSAVMLAVMLWLLRRRSIDNAVVI